MQMKKYLKVWIKTLLSGVMLCMVCNAWADLYTVSGVNVSAESVSALEAKERALAEGQVEAFNQLLTRLVNAEKLTQLPPVTEESVLSYVQGVSIESEKTSATKYIGKISVQFDPKAVRELLGTESVPYLTGLPPSLLIVPEYDAFDKKLLLTTENPLYQGLKEEKTIAPFYQAIVPIGTEEEQTLTISEVNEDTSLWKRLLSAYNKEKIMLLKLTQESEDVWRIETSFYPATSMENQRVYKKFRFSGNDVKAAAVEMTHAVFNEMEARWRADRTNNFEEKKVLYLRIPVQSLSEWLELEKQMKNWSFFESAEMRGLYLPQVLVEVSYKTDIETITSRLGGYGWQLHLDATGNGASLTRGGSHE